MEIRPIVAEEFEAFAKADAAAFSFDYNPDAFDDTKEIMELERTLAAFDGEEIVGTAAIFSWDLAVPGGSLPAAGVTWVSVKPTHRRQGILSQVMRRQLEDVRERGEAIAALWASESIIYGRFGYGLAAQGVELEIDRTRTALAHEPRACGRVRLVERQEALRAWPAVYERVRAQQPGAYTRSETWWKHKTLPEKDRSGTRGFGGRFYVQYEEDGEALGYARYRVKGDNQQGVPNGTLAVQELMAANDAAYSALWRYLFGVDLIGTIQAHQRPADEPLFWMLADPRRLARHPADSLWVRLVDVPAALEHRRYAVAGSIVLGVRDAFCSWNEGRYELEAGAEGARCRPTTAEADLTLSAADLGAAYLGGARLSTLRRAGRVEGDDEALRRADAMFSWDVAPWCPAGF
jgi:predicted acetyltransferase